MLEKILRTLSLLLSLVMFLYYYFMDDSIKELIVWGVVLLINYIPISNVHNRGE
jgi:magnesium-transporting ATPase (P-type)